ncbi:MAG: hypothetical protein KJO11_06185 [Gemmatimonadetes bacterium]|nr:hypothetical protein [Gemmatimonadota bacterium]NNK62830.1 hypothetical protein [Gemmatimonadota bacterium]
MTLFGSREAAPQAPGFDLSRTIRRIVLLAFALIQAVLVARILLDLGVIPAESRFGDPIVLGSDALAAPVQGVGSALPFGLGGMMGGMGGMMGGGGGFNVTMVLALAGWTVVEGLVMRVVKKFDRI